MIAALIIRDSGKATAHTSAVGASGPSGTRPLTSSSSYSAPPSASGRPERHGRDERHVERQPAGGGQAAGDQPAQEPDQDPREQHVGELAPAEPAVRRGQQRLLGGDAAFGSACVHRHHPMSETPYLKTL